MTRYRELDSERIVQTLEQLYHRINERFPGSSLAGVAHELFSVGRDTEGRLKRIARPNWPIRVLSAVIVVVLGMGVVAAIAELRVPAQIFGISDFVQGIDAAINTVIFTSLGVFFLFTLETRLKRHAALGALHTLRSIAHIVDMHQLTKDPEQILNPDMERTASSPVRTMTRFELSRYLDYCSELLSMVGKIASLYLQYLRDPVILEAVNDIESLSVGLARKVWQKIMILGTIDGRGGPGEG